MGFGSQSMVFDDFGQGLASGSSICALETFFVKIFDNFGILECDNFLVFVLSIFQFGRFSEIDDFDQFCSQSGCHPIREQ